MIKNHSKSACTRNGDYDNGWLNSRKRECGIYETAAGISGQSKTLYTDLDNAPVKLVDGMKACQNASNGKWLKNMTTSQSSSAPP